MLEVLRFSFEALKDRKLRSVLTILMVIIGSSLMVSINGMGEGMNAYITEALQNLAPNVLIVTKAPIIRSGQGGGQTNPVELNQATITRIKQIPGVEEVIPVVMRYATLKTGGQEIQTTVIGIDQTKVLKVVPTLELEEGQFVSPYDATGLVVGHTVKQPPGRSTPLIRLGQVVTLEYNTVKEVAGVQKVETKSRSFVVKGILKEQGVGAAVQFEQAVVISPIAATSFFETSGKYDALCVVTNSADITEEVAEKIREAYHGNIGVMSQKSAVETIQRVMSGVSVFLLAIAAVSLIVAAVGIVTTLFTSVMERTREIGVLKALGFKNSIIMMLFLGEAIMIGVIGASLGLIVGGGLGYVLLNLPTETGYLTRITPVYSPQGLLFIWIFSIIVSAIAGFYPSWRASKLDPVVALRRE
ncbi:MAG: ABC transporter permease [Candidatus Bathyarchaeota archaeon]